MLTPPELATKLNVSLRTVYNYIDVYKKSIATHKVWNKTFYSYDDLKKALQQWNNNLQSPLQSNTQKAGEFVGEEGSLQDFAKLQNELQTLKQEKDDLNKYNTTLQDNANKYALAFKEERQEKEKRINEYTKINDKYNNALTDFTKEKVKYTRYVYILVALLCVALTVIAFLYFK